ncbi:hypothetical protein DL764_000651 [Monosporascus ibericus]|uniref:Trafficking protein particle complex subunit n=1 Tax=Monosporascus ibericus TaxID=155417 RepID=A0A4Q4TUG7_9PEZI|nr:hypothetical protein DL764_000651 [Monosporascus ibericus]
MPIQVYSFYIFDRHTECVYSKLWLPPARPQSVTAATTTTTTTTTAASGDALITSPTSHQQPFSGGSNRSSAAGTPTAAGTTTTAARASAPASSAGVPASTAAAVVGGGGKGRGATARRDRSGDDAKLIFGTVFSLRNMARKLGGDDDAFISYRTAHYKLHYYETPTNLRFALLTEPGALSMRNVLHQIYINLWVEYVVKNPLSPVEHKGGEGVRNEMFEMGLDKFIRGLM